MRDHAISRPQSSAMRSLRARLTLTHGMVALLAVLLVGALSTVLINNFFQRFARAQQVQDVAHQLGDLYDLRGGDLDIMMLLRRRPRLLLTPELLFADPQ